MPFFSRNDQIYSQNKNLKKIAVVLPGDLSQNTQKNTATLILIAKFIFIS